MKKSKVIISIIGLIILALLIYKIGPSDLIETLKSFNFNYLPLIIITLLLGYVLSAVNIWILTMPFRKVSLINTTKYTFFTLFFAVFIPGKLAELLMIHFLRKEKLNTSQSTITVFYDKIVSLFVKVVLGLIGAIFILKQFNFLFIGLPLIASLIIVLALLAINSKKFINFIKKNILRKYSFIWKDFSKNLKAYKKRYRIYLGYDFLVTLIKSFVEALLFFLLFLSFGQHVDVIKVFFVFSLLSVIILLAFPIGISGLGVRELIGIIVFSTINVNAAIVFDSFMLRIALIYLISLILFTKYHDELNLLKKSKILEKINI